MGIGDFSAAYRGKRVLVTGHSGFKGSWLTLWLHQMGATVAGLSLPEGQNTQHWHSLSLSIREKGADIRRLSEIETFIRDFDPEIVFHLAAQPLVRLSYAQPLETWETNVLGTANVLEACRSCKNLRAIVAITTDKCYRNNEWVWGYRETDHLGGHDPYSASKAGSELVCASYRASFYGSSQGVALATARAGNVIGGGDWSIDRLIPDLARAAEKSKPLVIRSPHATRPWQHVLDCLSGYLLLGAKLMVHGREFGEAWNFGPADDGNLTVQEVLTRMRSSWPSISWSVESTTNLHEAKLLMLDTSKAKRMLSWKPIWDVNLAIEKTAQWYRRYIENREVVTLSQIEDYVTEARRLGAVWAQ